MAKPHKPFWRFRNIALLVICGPLVMIVVAIGWAVTRPPGKAGKYADDLDRLVQSRQPGEGANGWPMMLAALEARAVAEKEFVAARVSADRFSPVVSSMYESWWLPPGDKDGDTRNADERRNDVKAIIEELRAKGVLERHAALARATRAARPKPQGEVYSVLLPELGMMRQSARMLGARYALAAEEGDVEEMIASYEQLLALSRMAKAQFTLIDHLVGIAIEALANDRVREMMMLHPLEGEKGTRLAKGLLAAMDREQPLMARVDHALAGERLGLLDAVEWTHTDDGSGGGVLIVTLIDQVSGGGGASAANLSNLSKIAGSITGLAFRGKAGTVERVNMVMEKAVAASRLPRVLRDMSSIEDVMTASLTWRDRVLSLMLPALGKSLMSQDQGDLTRLGLRTMLALELFRNREGHYPARLEELVGRDLPLLAEDPIAGGLLRYKLLGNGVVDPNPWIVTDRQPKPDLRDYLLYSVGDDGVDNGGFNRSGPGNYDALGGRGKPRAQGVDYQINLNPDAPR